MVETDLLWHERDESMHENIELRDILRILEKRSRMILAVVLVMAIGTALVSYFVLTPIYEVKTDILVNRSDQTNTLIPAIDDIESNLKLIETYRVIIESPRIMDIVIRKLGNSLDMKTLLEKTRIEAIKDSQVITIFVDDPDQSRAVLIANTIATTFQEEIVKLVNINNVHILASAKVDREALPIRPQPLLNTAIAFVLGIATAIVIAIIQEKLDTTLHSEKDIEHHLGLPILAIIPVIERKDLKKVRNPNEELGGEFVEEEENG